MDPKSPSPGDEATSAPAAVPGLIDNLAALGAELYGSAHDHLQIAALETRRAVLSLVSIAVYGTVVGMLVAATWLATAGAMVFWLIDNGFAASTALLLGAALNLLGAVAFAFLIRRKSQVLGFPATLRGFDRDNTSAAPASAQADRK